MSSRSGPHRSPADFHFAENQGTRNGGLKPAYDMLEIEDKTIETHFLAFAVQWIVLETNKIRKNPVSVLLQELYVII